VEEVDDGPRRAGGAAEDGEDEEPGEEEDEDVGRPDARVHEPLGVLVQIRGRERLHVQLRHRAGGAPDPSNPRPPDRPPASREPPSALGRREKDRARRGGGAAASCAGACGGGIYRRARDRRGARRGGGGGRRGVQRRGRKINEAVRGTGEMEEGGRRKRGGRMGWDWGRKTTSPEGTWSKMEGGEGFWALVGRPHVSACFRLDSLAARPVEVTRQEAHPMAQLHRLGCRRQRVRGGRSRLRPASMAGGYRKEVGGGGGGGRRMRGW